MVSSFVANPCFVFFLFSITSARNQPSRTGLDVFIPLLHNAATAASIRSITVSPCDRSTRWLNDRFARISVSEHAKFLPPKNLYWSILYEYHDLFNECYIINSYIIKSLRIFVQIYIFEDKRTLVKNRSTVLRTLNISGLWINLGL